MNAADVGRGLAETAELALMVLGLVTAFGFAGGVVAFKLNSKWRVIQRWEPRR